MALQATDITFSYNSRFALAVGDMHADQGEIVGIIGANGCGKTTLLRILSGLLRPASGQVVLDAAPLAEYSANRRARHLAFVPQSHRPTFDFTVEQTVLLGRMPYHTGYGGFERSEDLAAANEAIVLMELEPLRYEPVTRLSGGELQRVMIAKALAQNADTLVLDEPNSHLDIGHQLRVLQLVRQHARARNICVVASMHDLNLASIFCDRLVAMAGGTVIAQGTAAEVLQASTLRAAFNAELVVEPNVYGSAPLVRYGSTGAIAPSLPTTGSDAIGSNNG